MPLGVLASLIDAAPPAVEPDVEPDAAAGDGVAAAAVVEGAAVVPVEAVSDVLEQPAARNNAVAPMADTMRNRDEGRVRTGTDGDDDDDEFMSGYTTARRREIEQRVNHRAEPNATKSAHLQGRA
jgi:hypothetical protein